MRVTVADNIADIGMHEWNRLAGEQWPFLRHEFLAAAEVTGCVSPATGWRPQHIVLHNESGRLVAAMPLYEKTHSWGEFVFDWTWAQAYHRAGIDYYPKLVSAVPFTPAPCRKLLAEDSGAATELVRAALALAADSDCSSLHIQFPDTGDLPELEACGLKLRKDCQFHWHNRDYRNFDEFLSGFSSAKRKKVRRDRRHVREQGIRFRRLHGNDIDRGIWEVVHDLIGITFRRRGSLPYFSRDFFIEVARLMPQRIMVVLAERNREIIAAAVFYVGDTRLYGRYWGADADYNALHFETCYYQGIDYCIDRGLDAFEPGTQGEHKISRGFQPVATWSAHWLARPEFFAAIGRYLDEEKRYIERYMEAIEGRSPYRDDQDERPGTTA